VAVPPLRGLVDAGFDVALVVSGADRRRGRGSATSPSPVKAAAVELGLPVTSRVDDVLGRGADLGVVVAFGRLIKPHVLAEVPMLNLHFSLLPRWRGAAPVERALLAGDEETGVCLWSRPAVDLHREVRLGRAWTTFRDGRLRVLRARVVDGGELSAGVMPAGEGALELLEVQPEGKRPMSAAAWLAGARPQPGERLV
jgi:methionyl-tRNA formyltransferase